MQIRPFQLPDADAVVALWERCGLTRAWNDPRKDIRRKLAVRPGLGEVGGAIVGSVMAGYDGHRDWINYLGVDPAFRRRGLGRALMREAERRLHDAGCPKINLQVRTGMPKRLSSITESGSHRMTWSAWERGWSRTTKPLNEQKAPKHRVFPRDASA